MIVGLNFCEKIILNITGKLRIILVLSKGFKLRVSFDGLLIGNKVFLESSHRIETHLDVVVEVV